MMYLDIKVNARVLLGETHHEMIQKKVLKFKKKGFYMVIRNILRFDGLLRFNIMLDITKVKLLGWTVSIDLKI